MERDLLKKKLLENASTGNGENMLPPSLLPGASNKMKPPRPTTASVNHPSTASSSSSEPLDSFKPIVDYSPFFNNQQDIFIEDRGSFRVYINSTHISGQNVHQEPKETNHTHNKPSILVPSKKSDTALVFIHGAGLTSLSWALCIHQLQQFIVRSATTQCNNVNMLRSPPTPMEMSGGANGIVDDYDYCAIDLRGHGASHSSSNDLDLSVETLVDDIIAVLSKIYHKKNFVFIGHSLGGSLAVRCAAKLDKMVDEHKCKMFAKGVIVLDMVEGSAIQSLPNTKKFLELRPQKFKNVESAIKWSIQHGVVNNLSSAVISIPSQLQFVEEGQYWEWRTQLVGSEKYWTEWFTDMSKLFLSVKAVKLLMITSTDILDKELTIAQMQGKFQMKVLNRTGHCIQEDDPEHTAEVIFSFLQRFRL